MQYIRNDVTTVFNFLFPEPLEEHEYVCIPYGDPNGGRWNNEIHVQRLEELLAWLDSRPNDSWNYGIKWQTALLPPNVKAMVDDPQKSKGRTNNTHMHRAWAMIVDIEDTKNHVYTEYSKAIKKLWRNANSDLPEWLTEGAQMIAYTGGGLHAYLPLSRPVGPGELRNLLTLNPEREGAFAYSYDYKKNRWIDKGSFSPMHGQRLVGTLHPKHNSPQVVVKLANITGLRGVPVDVDGILSGYQARLDYLDDLDRKKERSKASRAARPGDNAFEVVKQSIDIIDYFHIEHKTRGKDFTPNCKCIVHDEQTPGGVSVTHRADGDYYKCFGETCEFEGGDCFDLYQYIHGCDKYEALQALAEHAGVPLEKYKQERPKGKQAPSDIVDVGTWLTGNGAQLDSATLYRDDKGLGMRIPFNMMGTMRTLDVGWDAWKSPTKFEDCVMCQLLTSFNNYPKKSTSLRAFLKAILRKVGPDGVKDESVKSDVHANMVDQFWGVVNSCVPLEPENLEEWSRRTAVGTVPDPKPDWWEDALDFMTDGRTAVVYRGPTRLFLRTQGLLMRLRIDYGGEWTNDKLTNIMKRFKFRRGRRMHYGHRLVAWEAPLEAIEWKLKR